MRERGDAKTRSFVRLLLGVLVAAVATGASAADIKIATVAPDGSRFGSSRQSGLASSEDTFSSGGNSPSILTVATRFSLGARMT